MFNFKIKCDKGTITIVRARNRRTAIKLFIQAESCSAEWFSKHCKVRKITEKTFKNRS